MSDINLSGFPVLCSSLQQSNGKIHPKINEKLHYNDMQKLQDSTLRSFAVNQNIMDIPTGNIIMMPTNNQ